MTELPMSPGYGGCKSWVELEQDVATTGVSPVLSDDVFAEKLNQFRACVK